MINIFILEKNALKIYFRVLLDEEITVKIAMMAPVLCPLCVLEPFW